MSEHQTYEFVALERPLSATEFEELRAISSRAELSATHFWNEYRWGSLKADPRKLMERYFDAHLYFANWGTRRLMLRVPRTRVDLLVLQPYFVGKAAARLTKTKTHAIVELSSDPEEPAYDDQSPASLATLAPLRAELMTGDLRPAYLAWLLAVSARELSEDAEEPPVPPGLGELTAAQEAMVELLRIDVDLVAAAAAASAVAADDGAPFRRWLAALSAGEKDAWLTRAANEPDLALGGELLRAFRATATAESWPSGPRRTVGALLALADAQRVERETADAARARRTKAAAAAARNRLLTKLAQDVEGAWDRLEALVSASDYDAAVELAVDLRALAERDGTAAVFALRFAALRTRHARRRGFFDRWRRAHAHDAGGR